MPISGSEIHAAINNGDIEIYPFDKSLIRANSIDVRLAKTLFRVTDPVLDLKKSYGYEEVIIDEHDGYLLLPGEFYLGVTKEWTYTPKHVPILEGRSSSARYNLVIHQTAGYGDTGFAGHWTLEITVTIPTIVYPNIRIGQLRFEPSTAEIQYSGNYKNAYTENPKPQIGRAGNF